ncbi:unnamed protein product [Peronospora farinosa]|uniref:Uncharacterized protein n=1 Tax=Peronospora farinosa TaxID=134698 RepID=A0AAV0UG31_9STRA|nr:unnamed protein product [Peronospora farinosa]CAI5734745.1 unnamed protein product [Peronospora farinosa]
MSRNMYATWATFDVEKELERVDKVEERETQQKQQQKQIQAKENIESFATQTAQQSADILTAQAAVAALKAKKRKKKTCEGRASKEEVVAGATDAESEKIVKLQTQARLYTEKHELLQEILENRRLGDKIGMENSHEAQKLYKTALAATKKLEELAPVLLQVEEEHVVKRNLEDTSRVCKEDTACGQQKSCSHDAKQEKKKSDEVLPKANDLLAMINMFYKDIYMGIGTCAFEEGRLAAATEAFKQVLLRDEKHVTAWLKRGEAFEKMDASLLAMLHYNQITNLNTAHEMGNEALKRVKMKLLDEGDAENDKIKRAISAYTEGRTIKEVLERIQWAFEEANVLAVESFFHYSTTQFQVVLGCLEALRARPEISFATENVVLPVLRELEMSCHLNIASGCLEMQRNYAMGLTHCQHVLRLDSKCAIAYFRTGQLYRALHNYKKALECYEIARVMVPTIVSGQTKEQHEKMLTMIVKETDKCKFDRNQYDIEYLRSLAAKKCVDE